MISLNQGSTVPIVRHLLNEDKWRQVAGIGPAVVRWDFYPTEWMIFKMAVSFFIPLLPTVLFAGYAAIDTSANCTWDAI